MSRVMGCHSLFIAGLGGDRDLCGALWVGARWDGYASWRGVASGFTVAAEVTSSFS